MGQRTDISTLTAFAQKIKDTFGIKDKTEAQALVLSSTYPNCVYYTSDTHCIVIGGNIYGRGEQIVASNFAFLPASEPGPGHDPTFQDTTKIYVQPDSSNPGYFKLWWYLQSDSTWINGGSFPLDIPLTAEDISYDLTPTPDLGTGDVQSAIEAVDGKVERLSLDTMGKDESGEYWEDELHEVYGYSELSNNHRIGANYAGTSSSGYYIFIFPSSEGDVWKVEKAAGSGRWEGFWKGGTAYSSITAANHLQSWQQASGTFTAPADTTLFAVVTNTANLQLTSVWKKTTKTTKTPADIQRQLIEGWVPSAIATTDLDVGDKMPYWSVATSAHGVRIDVRKGQVLLLDLVRTGGAVPLVFTDENRVIIEKHESPVYGAFEAPNDGYAYLQKLISHESDNYLYVMGYGGHAKDMADNRVARDELQAQFDALYQKGVADGAGMASIAGLGYNVYDYISGEIDLTGFEYGVNYRKNNPSIKVTAKGKWMNNTSLYYFPDIDLSTSTSLENAFSGCTNLVCVHKLDTPLVTRMNGLFYNCSKLQGVGDIDGSAVVSNANNAFRGMFSGCTALRSVGKIDTSKANNIYEIFCNCSSLERVEELNFRTVTPNVKYVTTNTLDRAFLNCTKLRYILIKEIGTPTSVNSYNLSRLTVWGVASTAQSDARESLIDSLITYIKDRVQANADAKQAAIDAGTYDESTWTDPYSACTITLSANTKALLTTEELEQITAKGYTIA